MIKTEQFCRNKDSICMWCKRKMTNNLSDPDLQKSFAVDIDDWECDTCGAHGVAVDCIKTINAEMSIFEHGLSKSLYNSHVLLKSKLKQLQDYWIKFYTEKVDVEKYHYWYYKLKSRVLEMTDIDKR